MCKESSKTILLTIDLTRNVADEAIKLGISHIISYHPLIFHPLKTITDQVFLDLIRNDVSVYSPHTQLDSLINAHMIKLIGESPGKLSDIVKKVKTIANVDMVRIVRSNKSDF
jgi:putative NIF3 family GTP cyclohydrolase 1 type 2